MKQQTKEDKVAGSYRKIEAMYRQGYSADDICRATGLEKMNVLDVMQNLFAKSRYR